MVPKLKKIISILIYILKHLLVVYDKSKNINEYIHARDLIKRGTDYLLLTFNSSATKIDKIYCQVFIILYIFPY